MRRLMLLLLVLAMTVTLVACGQSESSSSRNDDSASETQKEDGESSVEADSGCTVRCVLVDPSSSAPVADCSVALVPIVGDAGAAPFSYCLIAEDGGYARTLKTDASGYIVQPEFVVTDETGEFEYQLTQAAWDQYAEWAILARDGSLDGYAHDETGIAITIITLTPGDYHDVDLGTLSVALSEPW